MSEVHKHGERDVTDIRDVPPPGELCEAIEAIVGPRGVITEALEMAPYLTDRRGRFEARAPLVARPASTGEVRAVVRYCANAGIGIVPQGGNTGLVGGSVPDASGAQIVLSLERMRAVREVDPLDFTATVEAGCILAEVQAAADRAGLLFPLSLAAEGSCRIGGNLATNAGGTGVLRYGSARDLVLGLEVVLASGEVWNGLRRLRKDNTGYCLKQLFVGSEGTLGIITAAVLKLFPKPRQVETALIAVADESAANRFLAHCRQASGDAVTAFEYIDRSCLELVLERIPDVVEPLSGRYEHYVLVELSSAQAGADLRLGFEQVLEQGIGGGEVLDGTIAASLEQAAALWRIRESIPEAARAAGEGIRHDVSVPVSRVPEFLVRARAICRELHPAARVIAFGHLGDGNIHFNMTQPEGIATAEFLAPERAVHAAIYELVASLDGSFSAEHGVGRLKRDELLRYRSEVEVGLMRALKGTLDPLGILNPGKVL